jgi:hypothetical protein
MRTLLARYPTPTALREQTNGQRTSTRSGIEKADAVLRYARILADGGVHDLAEVAAMMTDQSHWDRIDTALADVPGDGQNATRRDYLWMLCGRDDLIKPDRIVLRWLARHAGEQITAAEAGDMLARAANELTERLDRTVTPWMADHAIWKAETDRPTILLEVEGLPPIKNEALSLFAAAHPQRERVQRLVRAAAEATGKTG